jgi:hypothetical protein
MAWSKDEPGQGTATQEDDDPAVGEVLMLA